MASSLPNDDLTTTVGEKQCGVCLEDLKHQLVKVPCCGNTFCQECFESWRSRFDVAQQVSHKCPMCRHTLPPTEMMTYYLNVLNAKYNDIRTVLDSGELLPIPPRDRLDMEDVSAETIMGAWLVTHIPRGSIQQIHSLDDEPTQQQTAFRALLETHLEWIFREKAPIEKAIEETKHFPAADTIQNAETVASLPSHVVKSVEEGDVQAILDWLYDGKTDVCPKRIGATVQGPVHVEGGMTLANFVRGITLFGLVTYASASRNMKLGSGVELSSILLQLGACVDHTGSIKVTLFEIALHGGWEKEARHLLTWGAKIDQQAVDRFTSNGELKQLLNSPLGGRRCEVVGLEGPAKLNGRTGIATKHLPNEDSYVLVLESNQEEVKIPSAHLKRRDRTPTDCGIHYSFEGLESDGETPVYFKKFVGNNNELAPAEQGSDSGVLKGNKRKQAGDEDMVADEHVHGSVANKKCKQVP